MPANQARRAKSYPPGMAAPAGGASAARTRTPAPGCSPGGTVPRSVSRMRGGRALPVAAGLSGTITTRTWSRLARFSTLSTTPVTLVIVRPAMTGAATRADRHCAAPIPASTSSATTSSGRQRSAAPTSARATHASATPIRCDCHGMTNHSATPTANATGSQSASDGRSASTNAHHRAAMAAPITGSDTAFTGPMLLLVTVWIGISMPKLLPRPPLVRPLSAPSPLRPPLPPLVNNIG